jgi:hypothetical protein
VLLGGGGGDVLPKHLLVPDADRGVAMDEFPLTVLLNESRTGAVAVICRTSSKVDSRKFEASKTS